MNNPQREKGHIRIATGKSENDVLAALISAGLTAGGYQIALIVLRKTWGFQKKEDWISLTQFEKESGIGRSGVCKIIKELVSRRILVTRKLPDRTFYSFNKKFGEWVVSRRTLGSVPQDTSKVVSHRTPPQYPAVDSGSVLQDTHKKKLLQKEIDTNVSVAVATPGFFPQKIMSDFVVTDSAPEKKQKKATTRSLFTWQDDADLVRVMKATCGFSTLDNGKKPQDNFARHILVKLYKILTDDYGRDPQDALDHIRANTEEFCKLVQRARDNDKFLWKRLTTLKNIYYEISTILEVAKEPKRPKSTHISL